MRTGTLTGFDVTLSDDGVALIRFNQPDTLNAFTRAAKRDLIETLLQAQMDDRVRIVVFTGSGRAFVAGDDINSERQNRTSPQLVDALPYEGSFPLRTYDSLRSASQLLNLTVRHLDKITIAALHGHVVQSGLSLALACDFRIAADDVRLTSGTMRMGYLPDEGGHWLLVQHLGVARTLDFLLYNRVYDASQAQDLGLVHEVVSRADLESTALERARSLAQGPQVAMRLLKRAVYTAASVTFEQALDDIATKTAITDHHADAIEGKTAFKEKRPPRFNAWLENGTGSG
jgi:2-(1,2-epoxy-1,2-dihydrophenyl)acetyl-CoA isomerase